MTRFEPTADRPPSLGGLTPLDLRILDALPTAQGVRLSALVEGLNAGLNQWSPKRTDADEVMGILRGFEHLGKVSSSRGWWRRLDPKGPKGTHD